MFARYEITPASPWASLLSQDNGDFVWTADLSLAASARIVLVMIQGVVVASPDPSRGRDGSGAHRCHSEIATLRTEPGEQVWRWPVGHDAPLFSSWADVARPNPSMGGPAGGSGRLRDPRLCVLG